MPTNNKKKGRFHNAKKKKTPSLNDLIQAGDAADTPQQALALYSAALKLAPSSGELWEKRAAIQLSLNNPDTALQDYQTALKCIQDSTGLEHKAGLLLTMGQLQSGKDALDTYRQGMELYQRALQEKENDIETRRQLAEAYCAIAELFLTDLCFDENAEAECEHHVLEALRLTDADGDNFVDCLRTAASLRLSQQRGPEAVDLMLRAYSKVQKGCEALASLVGLGTRADESLPITATELPIELVQSLPGYEFRCHMAKLLLECAGVIWRGDVKTTDPRPQRCIDAAVHVLGSLLAENDEVLEIWILVGDAFAAMNPPNKVSAEYHWSIAKEMLHSVQLSLEHEIADGENDEEEENLQRQLDEVICQLEEVSSKIEELGSVDEEDMEEDMEEEAID